MEAQGTSQQSDLDEILRAAREMALTLIKDWILRQIRGEGASERPTREEPGDESIVKLAREENDTAEDPKMQQ
ncbi:hypothetical protein NDU88_004895 [Pleurodeles waltl]|uniref:Uncharacterized protein n=1 Tax=Pleurodeles waltl TaxID=8319 RepID=A0AAV7QGT7_PLEWA|nr:hypothetical protein NDU88_004895 [Pleurodeles waltl]